MKDFLDELDQEIDLFQTSENDIIDQHILLNEWLDWTTENIEAEKRHDNQNERVSVNRQNKPRQEYKPKHESNEIRGKFISKFPETKFYLPSLREGYTRFIPVWWNNETWAKNMWMLQYWDDIIIIDCWVQFADPDMLWVNYSIPDVSFLVKYKKNIKGFLITHAHLDHIGSLKHVYPALGCPPLYW